MNALKNGVWEGLDEIVAEFTGWVKVLSEKVVGVNNEQDVMELEMDLREGGQAILLGLMQRLLQSAVDGRQEASRICPRCGSHRHHQGVRPRRLLNNFGSLSIRGIYWRCEICGECGHSAEELLAESMSKLMRGLICLLGVSLASFDKAELVARRIVGVAVDDNTIRRLCEKEGWTAVRQQDELPPPVAVGAELIGSCDGTSVRTRETGWREIKAFRFEHESGCYGGAYLERVEQFVPRMVTATHRLQADQAGRRLFLSDMAVWITDAVSRDLSDWNHIADYWHACQHLFPPGEVLYGQDDPRAAKWSRYWCRRLRMYGAEIVDDRLCSLAMHYTDLKHQRAVLDLAAFLRRHADRMDYPTYERKGWTISSGPMESFCKQIGQRMKGPGMRWNESNVSPMASLVSRWALDGARSPLFGAVPCAN